MKEALYISEERVGEMIRVIRAGLKACEIIPDEDEPVRPNVRRETAKILERWCEEEEAFLRSNMRKAYQP